jgi:hypothetical protein
MRLPRFAAISLLTAAVATSAWSWGDIGHEAVVLVALKHCNPATLVKIHAILDAQHLAYKDPVLLATWPDHKRMTVEDHPDWHYADYGFSTVATIPAVTPKPENAEWELNRLVASIPSATGDDAGRQMAWLFHLVGDVHQPLHASSESNDKLRDGDHGGNLIQVRADSLDKKGKKHHSLQKLHHLWDDIFDINTPNVTPQSVADEADKGAAIAVTIPSTPTGVKAMIHGWLMESSKLAKDIAYRQDGPASAFLAGHTDLPPAYESKARIIALKRIKAAGYRLAALMDRLYGKKPKR